LLLHELPDLKTLSGEQKDALIEQLWQEHQALQKVLAGRGKTPKKTAENSSLPPSKGFKKNQSAKIEGVKRQASVGRAGGGRALEPHPHQTIVGSIQAMSALWQWRQRGSPADGGGLKR
jgi:transposase